jgi:N-formylglutamate amidohydrolase
MTAWEGAAQPADVSVEAPLRAEPALPLDPGLGQAFALRRAEGPGEALVFASPHSGRDYPAELMAAAVLDAAAIRRSEDAFVDELIACAPACGASTITARYARAFIDVNREAYELDQAMFEDELPAFAKARTARVAAGLGSIAKVVGEGQEIYRRKLTFAEARRRIEGAHRPYHQALAGLVSEARARHGRAILIDWHSMPSAASGLGGAGPGATGRGAHGMADRARNGCDMVLGDRFGSACAPQLTRLVERELEAMGYRVARNAPYAGGYTTEFYGRPAEGVHALQIEINRAAYLDESALKPTAGFDRLKRDIERLTRVLAREWRKIL